MISLSRSFFVAGALMLSLSMTTSALAQFGPLGNQMGERKSSRVLRFKTTPSFSLPWQYGISYGAPAWKPKYEQAVAGNVKAPTRMRLGKDGWAELDTNVDIMIGGVHLAPNQYYLILQLSPKGKLHLIAKEAQSIRSKRLDAYLSSTIKGGKAIPLDHKKMDERQDDLHIRVMGDPKAPETGKLHIKWGKHHLSAPILVKPNYKADHDHGHEHKEGKGHDK